MCLDQVQMEEPAHLLHQLPWNRLEDLSCDTTEENKAPEIRTEPILIQAAQEGSDPELLPSLTSASVLSRN